MFLPEALRLTSYTARDASSDNDANMAREKDDERSEITSYGSNSSNSSSNNNNNSSNNNSNNNENSDLGISSRSSNERPNMATDLKGYDGGRGYSELGVCRTLARLGRCVRVVLRRSVFLRILLPLLFLLTIVKEVLAYFCGTLTAAFYPVLVNRDEAGFAREAIRATVVIFAMVCAMTALDYAVALAQIHWRKAMTAEIHDRYFANNNFYTVNSANTSVSNPDQRITQDISELSVSLSEKIPVIFISPLTTSYYIYKSVTITQSWLSPIIAIAFSVVCSLVGKVFMSLVVRRLVEQQRREATFRKQHLDVVNYAENIAFFAGSDQAEYRQSKKLLDELLQTQSSVARRYIGLNWTLYWAAYFFTVVAFIICSIPIFNGVYDNVKPADLSGIISKNTFVTMYLASCFTDLLKVSKNLVTIEAMLLRITTLLDSMTTDSTSSPECPKNVSQSDPPSFDIEDVTLTTPGGDRILVAKLSLQVVCGRNILITGPSNCGKTSLLRVLRGLWDPPENSVNRRGNMKQVLFVPAQSFFGSSCETLRKTVTYPRTGEPVASTDDIEIFHYIEMFGLKHLLDRGFHLDAPLADTFLESLSSGERQRLALCRVLLAHPRMVFLDEALNSVDVATTSLFFGECRRLRITVICVSHQVDLLAPFHDKLLQVHLDGTWNLTDLMDHSNEHDGSVRESSYTVNNF